MLKIDPLARLGVYCFAEGDPSAGGGAAPPQWLSDMGSEAVEHVTKNGYSTESEGDLMKALMVSDIGAMSKLGRPQSDLLIKPSGEFAENKDAYIGVMRELGAPEDGKGYGDAPALEGLTFKDGMWEKFSGKLAETGVPPFLVQPVLEGVAELLKDEIAANDDTSDDAVAARRTENMDVLVGELGQAKADAAVGDAKLLLQQKGGEALAQKLEESRFGNDPDFIKFFAAIMADYKESGLIKTEVTKDKTTAMSKAEAQQELAKLEGDRQFMAQLNNRRDPNHAQAVKRRTELAEIALG